MKKLSEWLDALTSGKARKRPKKKFIDASAPRAERAAKGWSFQPHSSLTASSRKSTNLGAVNVTVEERLSFQNSPKVCPLGTSSFARLRDGTNNELKYSDAGFDAPKAQVMRHGSERGYIRVAGNGSRLVSCTQETSLSCYSSPFRSRSLIRTNPWLHLKPPKPRLIDLSTIATPKRQATIQNVTAYLPESQEKEEFLHHCLDDSLSSSGYGSQDSSPESSVHSPEWDSSQKRRVSHGSLCSPITLVSSLKVDKSVDCIADFYDQECPECAQEQDGEELDEQLDENGNNRSMAHPTGLDVLKELSSKLDKLRQKQQSVVSVVNRVKLERQERLRERQLYEEQLCFVKELRWVISNGPEVFL